MQTQLLIAGSTQIVDDGVIPQDAEYYYTPSYGAYPKSWLAQWHGVVVTELPEDYERGEFSWNPTMQRVERIPRPVDTALQASSVERAASDFDAVAYDAYGSRRGVLSRMEAQARDYAQLGYVGDVPALVAAYAQHHVGGAITAQAAAEEIVARADLIRAKEDELYAQMLASQDAMRTAVYKHELQAAVKAWNGHVSRIRTDLGLPTGAHLMLAAATADGQSLV